MSSASPPKKQPTQAQLDKAKKDLDQATDKLEEKKKDYKTAQDELKNKKKTFDSAEKALKAEQNAFNTDKKDLDKADQKVKDQQELLKKKEEERKIIDNLPDSDPNKPIQQATNDAEQVKLKTELATANTEQAAAKKKNDSLKAKLDAAQKRLDAAQIEKETADEVKDTAEKEKDAAEKAERAADTIWKNLTKGIVIIDPSLALKAPKDPQTDIKSKLKAISKETISDINKINNQTVKVSSLYVLENGAHSNSDIDAFISAITSNSIQNPIKNGNIYYLPESLYNELVKKMPNFKPTLKYIKPNDSSKFIKNITYQDILDAYKGNAVDITDSTKLTT